MDPVTLDFGGLVESLDAELAGLMRPEGNDAADVLNLFVDKLSTAVVSCDSPRFLSFIPAAPTKASLLFDMFVSSLVPPWDLVARGGRGRGGGEPGARGARPAGGFPRRSRRLLRRGGIRRQPLCPDGGARHRRLPPAGGRAGASARRDQRGRPLVGGQGAARPRRGRAHGGDQRPPFDRDRPRCRAPRRPTARRRHRSGRHSRNDERRDRRRPRRRRRRGGRTLAVVPH